MTEEQFRREKLYQATMTITRDMSRRGLLTEEEMRKIDTIMLEKYKPILGNLGSFSLTYRRCRGNM